jgi:hypothetical protein
MKMPMMCSEPKISITYHHAVVEQLTRQRDNATAECKETIQELNLMTQELKGLTETMKEQTDTIDAFLGTILNQKETIEQLEARIAALEKPDPDLSIYDLSDSESDCSDACYHEKDVPDEFDSFHAWIVGLLAIAIIHVALSVSVPLSHADLY